MRFDLGDVLATSGRLVFTAEHAGGCSGWSLIPIVSAHSAVSAVIIAMIAGSAGADSS